MTMSLTLYSYFRSSCSARVRTAANLKDIKLEFKYVNLLKNEQSSAEYSAINGCKTVPTLIIDDGSQVAKIQQSVAILEYFEEAFPGKPKLLPDISDPARRALVRQLVNIVACDIQPPTNLKILRRIDEFNQDRSAWAKALMAEGLFAFEQIVAKSSGKYCVGDDVTLADVVLAPAIEGALRYGVDLDDFPTIKAVFAEISKLDAFVQGNWRNQEDTPLELRKP
jgi:maleylacetoacetate isomerase